VIFYVQNNQFAISVARKKQTASATIAEKAFGYGFEGIQVDGNDLFAVYAATKFAVDRARKGGGPVLIEGYTYRLGAHTTADDPTKYREDKEVEEWIPKDPLIRLEKYVLAKKLITKKEITALKKDSKKQAQQAFEEAEGYQKETLDNTFRYTYKTIPPILEEQLENRRELEGGLA
jgi:pyruvate dehydrogenase E1 component alpha subunit